MQKIKPYPRNPRNNTEAVAKIKLSIEKYGYNNLIVVDKDFMIIAGHTRFIALQELGYDKINILVCDYLTEEEVKEFRIIDNKSAEFSTWTEDLKIELRELGDMGFMQNFFDNDLKLDIDNKLGKNFKELTRADIDAAKRGLEYKFGYEKARILVCPKCHFEVEVTGGKTN